MVWSRAAPSWPFERIEVEALSAAVVEALRLVTKIEGESYEAFVQRSAGNPISGVVKLADLEYNMDQSHIANVRAKDVARMEKYVRAVAFLKDE